MFGDVQLDKPMLEQATDRVASRIRRRDREELRMRQGAVRILAALSAVGVVQRRCFPSVKLGGRRLSLAWESADRDPRKRGAPKWRRLTTRRSRRLRPC